MHPRVALRWTPTGKRKRGRPKENWRRCVEGDERKRLDMGTSSALVPRQTGMEVSGNGLMYIPARSNYPFGIFKSLFLLQIFFIALSDHL